MKRFDLTSRAISDASQYGNVPGLSDADDQSSHIRLQVDDDVNALRAHFSKVTCVMLEFPVFRDGRAFTQARTLREKFDFKGEILAIGHPLPDQADFLRRCGFDAVLLDDAAAFDIWAGHETHFPFSYQTQLQPDRRF